MVRGPESTPLAGIALGLVHRRFGIARSAALSLVCGFPLAIAATALAALAGRALGWFGPGLLQAPRPQTSFITAPDRWCLVVAVLAGIAGVLSLTSAKSGALVGVFISVTTVPAAGAMAPALALGDGRRSGEAPSSASTSPGSCWPRRPRWPPRLRSGGGCLGAAPSRFRARGGGSRRG